MRNRFLLIIKIIFDRRFGWWLCGQVEREWQKEVDWFNKLNPRNPLN